MSKHASTERSTPGNVKLGTTGDTKLKIALDAGHGSLTDKPHTGASANGLVEDEITLDFVRRIGHHLRAAGHKTVITRTDNKLISLTKRAQIARLARCDAFVSIHCNAGPPAANGAEAFIAADDRRSQALAIRLVEVLANQGLRDRGVKADSESQHSRLAVLRGTYRYMPAVLLEVGFLTNTHDADLLKNPEWREETAIALADAVVGT